jgi:hypothetical protein
MKEMILTEDILINIFLYLEPYDIKINIVNKKWNKVFNSNPIWKFFYEKKFEETTKNKSSYYEKFKYETKLSFNWVKGICEVGEIVYEKDKKYSNFTRIF